MVAADSESSSAGAAIGHDCDGNGVDDAADVAFGTAADCNGNGVPDACDLRGGYAVSIDCNDNGIPDECDILSGYSADVNLNGLADECDARENIDLTPRSWPTEDDGLAAFFEFGEYDALTAYYEWCDSQTWGPGATAGGAALSGSEQFGRMIAKRRELGLPLSNPFVVFYCHDDAE